MHVKVNPVWLGGGGPTFPKDLKQGHYLESSKKRSNPLKFPKPHFDTLPPHETNCKGHTGMILHSS